MNHALVIGGTDMLAKVSLWLSENGYLVSVIGRNPEKMQLLLEQNPAQMIPVLVDYTNTKELGEQLLRIQKKNVPIHLVVLAASNASSVAPHENLAAASQSFYLPGSVQQSYPFQTQQMNSLYY